jgi:hypothetical protein
MKGEIRASISAVAAAAMLVACASKEPVSSRSAGASAQEETSAEYQRLADNANQQLTCKRQTVLGTRVPTVVCATQAELKAQHERTDEVMHDLQTSAPMRQATPDRPPPPPSPSPKQ